jgi:hypothetical protein
VKPVLHRTVNVRAEQAAEKGRIESEDRTLSG